MASRLMDTHSSRQTPAVGAQPDSLFLTAAWQKPHSFLPLNYISGGTDVDLDPSGATAEGHVAAWDQLSLKVIDGRLHTVETQGIAGALS